MNILAPTGLARLSVLRGFVALSRRLVCFALIVCALILVVSRVDAVQLLPGVYGYGTDRAVNPAGFGSNAVIVHVTNLGDRTSTGATVPGSLRDAVTKTIAGNPPRVVVFDVSGPIKATRYLEVTKPNVTIAGQAAPGPVAFEGAPFHVGASNVLVQHLRFRPGDEWASDIDENLTYNRDAVVLNDGVTNVVFDHCTFAWSLDEMAQGYYAYDNITFNRCIFAEPLFIAIHLDEGTFSPNRLKQAELLSFTTSGLPTGSPYETIASSLAVDTNYHRVNANSANDFIEYTIPIPASSSQRNEEHILISGIKGPNRGKFRVEVRLGTTLVQSSEEFDMYAPAESQATFVSRTGTPFEFSLGTAATTMKVKVIVTGKNTLSSGYTLGIDQISLTQPHGMGPYFRDGNNHRSGPTPPPLDLGGKLSIIGSVFAHLQARGPWVASKNLVLANNVFYNREQRFVMMGVSTSYAAMKGYIVGNTFMEGPDWGATSLSPVKVQQLPSGSQIRLVDNDYKSGLSSGAPAIYDGTNHTSNTTSSADGMSGFTPLSHADAFTAVLANAGAWPSQRDTIENRVINDIAASASISDYTLRQGNLKNTILEVGGWPNMSQNTVTWAEPSNPGGANGNYTNLEVHLHQLAAQVESTGAAPGTYPAENAACAGGAAVESNVAGYNGTGFVNFAAGSTGTPSTLTFTGIDGGSGGTKVLRIRNGLGSSSSRTGTLTINGVAQSITFNPTGAFTTWLDKDVSITLNSGASNTIVFAATGQDLANIDEITIVTPDTYPAENAACAGGAAVESNVAGYNGTGFVNFAVGSTGTPSTLTFTGIDGGSGGTKVLRIRNGLGSSSSRTGTLTINGVAQSITFDPTGAFTTWLNKDVVITLNSGTSNTIVFAATGHDLANIDEIAILTPSVHQSENGSLFGGAVLESINAGYNGTGYVNFQTGSSGSPNGVTISGVSGGASGGAKTLLIRYAFNSTSTRTGQLVINGSSQPITFTSTGSFTNWVTDTWPITLTGGSNTITLQATGQDLANIDEIYVY